VAAAAAAALGDVAGVQEALADADFGPDAAELEARTGERYGLPAAFVGHSHEPLGASALVLSLLISRDQAVRDIQLRQVEASGTLGLTELVNTLAPGVHELGPSQRLPLVELCLPALKSMSARQYRNFKDTLLAVIKADQKTELYEWCLFQLLRHYLDPEFVQVKASRPRYHRLESVSGQLHIVLSVLAHEGSGSAEQAFRRGTEELGLDWLTLLPLENCSVAGFSKAAQELADCYPLLKPRILKAMALAASANGDVCDKERELVRALAAVMDCPIPDDADSPLADILTPALPAQ
jgi:hypothetical protein